MSKIDANIMNLIEAGIKAEGLRQKAISSNVANMETPGYRRVDVNFKDLLARAMDDGESLDDTDVAEQLYRPENTPLKSNGNDVSLEVEIGQMVKNTLRHKTYIRLLQKKYAQMDLAINLR